MVAIARRHLPSVIASVGASCLVACGGGAGTSDNAAVTTAADAPAP